MKLWDRRRNIQAARSSALGRKPREDWKAVRMFTAPFLRQTRLLILAGKQRELLCRHNFGRDG